MERDYFRRPILSTARELASRYPILAPERFVGFSEKQRLTDPDLALAADAKFLWIQGVSLVTGKKTYVPAQQVSAAHRPFSVTPREPMIRRLITNGLATWPTYAGARLAGALECLEREAYMVMWFNQLTLPRAKLPSLRARSSTLDTLIARCERYGLKVHVVPMLTDAPTHAVCAVLEDASAVGPRFVLGLKANRSLTRAAEGAILEALRARRFTRREDAAKYFDPGKGVDAIGHRGRIYYWAIPEHAKHLEFLTKGEEKEFPEAAWENDMIEQHLQRVTTWCRDKRYECVAVSLGTSKKNPIPWHVEMVIIPELQPTHLTENFRHLGGERLKSVPEQFGYRARETPFIERPHPYC
jgi:ribosomal protein S12 methylthiotransferase accessory factor